MTCPLIKAIWWLSQWQIRIEVFADWTIERLILSLLNHDAQFPIPSRFKGEILNFAVSAMEKVWWFRNKIRYGEAVQSWDDVITEVIRKVKEYWDANVRRSLRTCSANVGTQWVPPLAGWTKINFDASLKEDEAVIACVMRNCDGEILAACAYFQLTDGVFTAEALAARQALKLAEDRKLTKVIIEGDAATVIQALRGQYSEVDWRSKEIIEEGAAILASKPM